MRTLIKLFLLPGVGFARMESREKCEQIIQQYNGSSLQGAKDALLVKFADGGSKKKNTFKNQDPNSRSWRDVTEVSGQLERLWNIPNSPHLLFSLAGHPRGLRRHNGSEQRQCKYGYPHRSLRSVQHAPDGRLHDDWLPVGLHDGGPAHAPSRRGTGEKD